MNKKTKIIVSIVGITIVLLALLGITYAYYLTRIQGNTNTNSISITTADLKLEYGDGTTQILTKENIVPDNNNPLGTKDFTVSNTGNTTIENYKVVLEYAVIEGVVPSVFKYPEDFEITLTCVSKNIETDAVSGTCSGASLKWNNESVEIVKNTIDSKIRHEYSLEIYYKDSGIDQSDDMGKNLNLKVQIYGETDTSTITGTISNVDSTYAMKLNSNPKISTIKNIGTEDSPIYQYKFIGVEADTHTLTLVDKNNSTQSTGSITINKGTNATIDGSTITVKDNQSNIYLTTTSVSSALTNTATFNPYSSNTDSLAYHIINNSINNTNGTEYTDNPLTTPAKEISGAINTGEYGTMRMPSSLLRYGFLFYLYGDSADEALNGDSASGKKCSELVGKYIYCSGDSSCSYPGFEGALKVESCDGEIPSVISETYSYENVLSKTYDDLGVSYYYRGEVKDNYLEFNNMCWRIVRIEGDGSIKIILAAQKKCSEMTSGDTNSAFIGTGNYGYTHDYVINSSGLQSEKQYYIADYLDGQTNASTSMNTLFSEWLSNSEIDVSKLKKNTWCIGNTISAYDESTGILLINSVNDLMYNRIRFYYNSYTRLNGLGTNLNSTLRCEGKNDETFESYIGTLTVDEVVYAGGKSGEINPNYYLTDNATAVYFQNSRNYWWTLSPYVFDSYVGGTEGYNLIYVVDEYGCLVDDMYTEGYVNSNINLRPVISLVTGTKISSGNGTIDNPYVIN